MTTLSNIIETLKLHKNHLTKKYGLSIIAIFGSYGREQQTGNSDVDILVDFDRPIGIEFIDLADELENITGKKIDLVCKEALKPRQLAYLEKQLLYVE